MRLFHLLSASLALFAVEQIAPNFASATPATDDSFVNWEHPHVTPLAITPSGARLLAVNTPDNRLEVFDTSGLAPVRMSAIPVGLDPVSVRIRGEYEAWVVNHVSDSISIVDLLEGRVVRTLFTRDEPADVVFAGEPERAFVTCSQENIVQVFDLDDLAADPLEVSVVGEEPRALTVSADGTRVYLAVYESGNSSTILGGDKVVEGLWPPNVVNLVNGPYSGQNPPPNSGDQFSPAINPELPAPPVVSHIVRKDAQGRWMDDNEADWTTVVSGPLAAESGRIPGWDLADHDLVIIDADSLAVEYIRSLMNINMALAVNPATGEVAVVGTDATNEVRFEPNLTSSFVRVLVAVVDPDTGAKQVLDLNDHLDYSINTIPQVERNKSIGDPRGIAWDASGLKAFVSGMGSNNLVVIDPSGQRAGLNPTIEVGEGPTGVVLDPDGDRLFVLNKFESSISVVDLATELESARTPFHDPSPAAIKLGRKHIYGTHETSGLGQVSCAACHIDSRMDRLAWDLGNPAGSMVGLEGQNLFGGSSFVDYAVFEDFHPMKGPLLTQTLQDIIGKEPFHWRGDKFGIEDFNGTFIGLHGDDEVLTPEEMQEMEDFLATMHFAPNPFRNIDNSLKTDIELSGHFASGNHETPAGEQMPNGNPVNGLALFTPPNLLGNAGKACATCHTLPGGFGTDRQWDGSQWNEIPVGPFGESHLALTAPKFQAIHTANIAPLRNLFERTGYKLNKPLSTAGFGIRHDGTLDGAESSLSQSVFFQITSDQMISDLVAFIKSLTGSELPVGDGTLEILPPGPDSQDTHAGVGQQVSFEDLLGLSVDELERYGTLIAEGELDRLGLVAQAQVNGELRSAALVAPGLWQSDRAAESWSQIELEGFAGVGSPVLITAVVEGHEVRIGLDRDSDGVFDGDEIDAGSDLADASSTPSDCDLAMPVAPTGLFGQALAPGRVLLSWDDVNVEELEYQILRSNFGQFEFELVATLSANATSFEDVGLTCGKKYDYRVVARNCSGAAQSALLAGLSDGCAGLTADAASVSVGTGGQQVLSLQTGPELAGAIYWVLGTQSGTSPGFDLGGGVLLPLSFDSYFQLTLAEPNSGALVNTQGVLDGLGNGQASVSLGANQLPQLAGITLHHAFVAILGDTAEYASNAVSLELLP